MPLDPRASADIGPIGPCPDELTLAAWCDGRSSAVGDVDPHPDLDRDERIAVHLATCPRCAELVAGLASTIGSEAAAGLGADASSMSLAVELAALRAIELMPEPGARRAGDDGDDTIADRRSWRFIAFRASRIAASVACALLGLWIGMKLAHAPQGGSGSASGDSSGTGDSSLASLSFGVLGNESDGTDSTDPLELVTAPLVATREGTTS